MTIIECPNCKSKFKLDENFINNENPKMRCSICSHVFDYQNRKTPSIEQEFESLLTGENELYHADELGEKTSSGTQVPDTRTVPEIQQESEAQPESVIKEIDSILGSAQEPEIEEDALSPKASAESKGSKKLLFSMLLILIIAGIGLWFTRNIFFPPKETSESSQEYVVQNQPFFHIPNDSVTYELMNNPMEGSVLLIKGMINKNSQKAIRSVLVQARLYNQDQKILETRNAYAGIVPDSNELVRQSKETIYSLLSAEPQTMGTLATSQEIPFVIVFFGNSAHEGSSFQVEVKEFNWQ
ncbi:MAG: zinc-ribbon domain-containing protein [Deltaproteobacteria bacterium]|nr:zinc-ribbon domain-containing protein [Deltaproteobacteria bacterium]